MVQHRASVYLHMELQGQPQAPCVLHSRESLDNADAAVSSHVHPDHESHCLPGKGP
jgi:hypothetical protein